MDLRQSLEEALAADPEDRAAHSAYADLLHEQGDPRGELIQIQLALEDDSLPEDERLRLRVRESALLAAHQRGWLGELAPYLIDQQAIPPHLHSHWGYTFQLRRGWLDTIEAGNLGLGFSRLLAHSPVARLLRRLIVREQDIDWNGEEETDDLPEGYEYAPLLPLLNATSLGNVRVLQLGETEDEEEKGGRYRAMISGETAADLVSGFPRLEELHLFAYGVDTDRLFSLDTLHHLRVLLVYHLDRYPLDRLANNPSLRRLTHLLLYPHCLRDDDDAYLDFDGVQAIVRTPYLGSLTHLRLAQCTAGNDGIREIVKSGILNRLRLLDLRHGCVGDEGARLLAACPDARNLELLNLTNNCLTQAGISGLRAAGINVRAANQWAARDPLSDQARYLYEGDYE